MEHLGYVDHVESSFGLFRDNASVSETMELLGDMDHVECRFYLFGDSVSFGVHAERTICLEIILDAPDGTPRLRGSCGI
jgi:hypothetical protein